MTKLEIIIKTAVNHCLNLGRSTIIVVPTNLRTQAYSVFVENYKEKKWSYNTGKGLLTLSVAEIKGEATPHYESVFIINPQDIEDSVLNEVKMIPTTDGLTICAKV